MRPDRWNLPQDPQSPAAAQSHAPLAALRDTGPLVSAGTPNFTGATLADTDSFPPDTMGAAGPSQFIVAVNGRLRSFNKTTGVADGVLNVSMDTFFNSVMTPPTVSNFTSDPHIRYDRLSGRWFIVMIDVPGSSGSLPNRLLLAVSNGSTITNASNFTFYFFQTDATNFGDYPTLGIDNNALYIGMNMFTPAGAFANTNAFVVRKSSLTGGGPIVVTTFASLLPNSSGAGPFTPQGVDNYDSAATEGYFIGVDNAAFGLLQVRRVSTPGGTPTLSGNLSVTVPPTAFPATVPHFGNTGGTNGRLDPVDDRLFAAHIRNGRLWTAHNIQVNTSGVASSAGGRNGSRWYELQNLTTTPTVVQSGTVFDNAATNPKSYWIPSIMVSGQGHVAMGFSTAGAANFINAGATGRLATDTVGTMQAPFEYTSSASSYNPPGDPGGVSGRRWGDFSYTSLDPNDDMTMWTIQEFADATNSYGVRVLKLLAPPPVTPSSASASVTAGGAAVNVVVTGTSSAGSGFFDPGSGFANRIAASVSGTGVTVNSVTYNSPTQVTLNLTASAGAPAGTRTITVTNPDGQAATSATAILSVTAAPATHFSVSAPASMTAGTAGNITVTALDANDNTATSYSGTVHFTSIDGRAVLPFDATLTNGVGTFSATLRTAGSQTITATDTVSSITGASGSISVSAGPAAIMAPVAGSTGQSAVIFTAFANPLTVAVSDAFGNAVSGANVTFTPPANGASAIVSPTIATTNAAGNAAPSATANGFAGGPYSVAVTSPGVTTISGASTLNLSLTNDKGSQNVTITSTPPAAVVGGTYNVTATGGASTSPVTFGATGACSINVTVVNFTAAGTCTVTADQAGDANYNAASQKTQVITVGKGSQTLNFTSSAPLRPFVGGPTYTPTATASSGLTVSLTIDAGSSTVCSLSSGVVSFQRRGTCRVNADQGGNANFNAAPRVQQFLTVAPATRFDFNADSRADLTWRNGNNGEIWQWQMNGATIAASVQVSVNNNPAIVPVAQWTELGSGDFTGDGKSDMLWRDSSGALWLWTMNGGAISVSAPITFNNNAAVLPAATWSMIGMGDFDGDGKIDVLWRNTAGEVWLWTMNGAAIAASAQVTFNNTGAVVPAAQWTLIGLGDCDGDGMVDALWRDNAGNIWLWKMNGSVIVSSAPVTFNNQNAVVSAAQWTLLGLADADGDGKADALWRNTTNGQVWQWKMNGPVIASAAAVTFNNSAANVPAATWEYLASADIDGDGMADSIWRNTTNGEVWAWIMNGPVIASAARVAQGLTPNWVVQGMLGP